MSHGPCGPVYQFCPKDRLESGLTPDGRAKIAVVDDFVKTIKRHRLVRRAIWRKVRDKALGRWEQAGLKFVVTEGDGYIFDYHDYLNARDIIARTIRLTRDLDDDRDVDFALYDGGVGGSIAAYNPGPEWWKLWNFGAVVGIVGHEMGHCLGLDHGGGGIMSGSWKPNAHDLASVRAYYLG